MTLYKKKLIVEPHVADVMEELCCTAPSVGRNYEFDQDVKFDNGLLMNIQVCNGDAGTYWTHGVLYKSVTIAGTAGTAGWYYEIACTIARESFLGKYRVCYEDDEYVVEVIRGKEQVEN